MRDCFMEALRIEAPVPVSDSGCFYEDVKLGGINIKAYDLV